MVWMIAMLLLILWLLGMITANILGGFIHLLLVMALIVVWFRVMSGRRAL